MFQFLSLASNTYYLRCFSNIGVYDNGDGSVILIDSGDHRKSVSDLDLALNERGWRVQTIINTHAHADHIVGNRFFREKYGCAIFAPETEQFFVEHSAVEPSYNFLGVPINRKRNFFFKPHSEKAEILTPQALPAGFEVLPLPGHSLNMVGIKTPDDVWFLADAILSEETYRDYGLPMFFDVNQSIETAKVIANLQGKLFVPAHAPAVADIRPLAEANVRALEERKALFLAHCDGHTFEEIFCAVSEDLHMTFDLDKYARVCGNARAMLQSLIDDGAITAHMDGAKMIYTRIG